MEAAMEWDTHEDTAMYLRDASRALHALAHANGLPVVRHALQAILARATLRRERRTQPSNELGEHLQNSRDVRTRVA
jgi:hypothetical protein